MATHDAELDGMCSSAAWLTLGKSAAFPMGKFDIHFRVVDAAT